MVSPRSRRIVRGESESEDESTIPILDPTRVPPNHPPKRVRRVVLDDEDEDEDEEEDNEASALKLPITLLPTGKSEDHELLLSSLTASRKASPSELPTLPAEILLAILDSADPADILDHRLVCKAFKNAVDTRVLYHHIQRVELIGYLGPKEDQLLEQLDARDYWDFASVKATFERLDERIENQAVWDPQIAYFRIDDSWYDTFARGFGEIRSGNPWWDHTVQCLELQKPPSVYGQLRWCVKVGPTVVDFGIADKDEVDIQLVEREDEDDDPESDTITIRVTDWKRMLTNVFREERALNVLLKATEEDDFTYSHLEDSLRDMRRKRYRSKLDPRDDKDGRYIWQMDNMTPLWGKYLPFGVTRSYDDVERSEHNAVRTLMLLRKEASMSVCEQNALNTIVVERAKMHQESREVDELVKKWQEALLGLPNLGLARLELDEDLDPNPMTWSQEVVDRESQNLARWKGQKQTIQQMKAYLDATNAAAAIAEDDFDDGNDDF